MGTKKSHKDTIEECLTEMFRRVGEKYPNPELTKHDNWFWLRTWTEAEEADFRQWMYNHLKKRYGWLKKKLDWEIGMFLMNWGWKNED